MKDAKIYIIMALSVVLSAALQGCGSSAGESLSLSKSRIESKLASEGELLIDNMIDAYKEIQDITFENDYHGAVACVLQEECDGLAPKPLLNAESRAKINVLYLYKQALHEFSVLADEGFTGRPAAFAQCSKSVVDALRELGDSAALAEALPVEQIVKSSRYDENAVADYLSNALGVLWFKDIETWNAMLDNSFVEFQQNLKNVPESAFSEDKLAECVSQPYNGKRNLVEIYKLNLIKERREKLNDLLKRQDNISASLQYLGQALKEFQKKGFDKDVVLNYLNRIQVMLDDNHFHEHAD